MGLAVFDVCDTLFATNTTVGFLRYLGEQGEIEAERAVRRWTGKRHPSFWIGAMAHRLLGRDIARASMIATLRGMARHRIEELAEAYVAERLPNQKNAELFVRVERHRQDGDIIWLASNGLEPVVSAIARSMGVQCVASQLGYDRDICTGELADDLTGRKAIALTAKTGQLARPMTVYTDNRTDRGLIAIADRAVIVVPRRRLKETWAGSEHDYLAL